MAIFQQPFLSGGFPSMNRTAGAVGGWVELGRTTLGAGADELDVSSLADKRYYMYLHHVIPDTYVNPRLRLGNSSVDTGSNYARRMNENGGTDSTATSADHITATPDGGANDQFIVGYIANLSTNEKLTLNHQVHRKAAGEANAPGRGEVVGKWTNTSNPLDVIRMYNGDAGSGDYDSGSELVILGWDPADTHTNNFWEELGSSDSTTHNISFTAKKYLWVQLWCDDSSSMGIDIEVNSDTGTNYAGRDSINGGTDSTGTSETGLLKGLGFGTHPHFINMFIINNTSKEKLCILHGMSQGAAGAGNAPGRIERVAKWDNTASQISSIQCDNSGTAFDSSYMRVWGAD